MGENVQYNKNVGIVIIFFFPPRNHLLGKLIIKEVSFFFFLGSYLLKRDVDSKNSIKLNIYVTTYLIYTNYCLTGT